MRESDIPPDFIDRIFANTYLTLKKVMLPIGVTRYEISDKRTLEVASFLLKDLIRLATSQDNSISITKFAAYWGFWIRKLKPIAQAWRTFDDREEEVSDVNERAALELAVALIKKSGKNQKNLVTGNCTAMCNGAECIERYLTDYFCFKDNLYSEYLIYSLGKRTFGPHHLCAVLDSIVFAACKDPGGKQAFLNQGSSQPAYLMQEAVIIVR